MLLWHWARIWPASWWRLTSWTCPRCCWRSRSMSCCGASSWVWRWSRRWYWISCHPPACPRWSAHSWQQHGHLHRASKSENGPISLIDNREWNALLTSAAGLPPGLTQWRVVSMSSVTSRMSPSSMNGSSGGTYTVSWALLDLMGATPSAAPTWHWNMASSSSSTGEIRSVQSSANHKIVKFTLLESWINISSSSQPLVFTVLSELEAPVRQWPEVRDKNGIKLMRLWKLYKITDNPRLDFNKMRNFYNKPLLTQIFLLTKFPVLLMSEVTKSGEWSQITGKKVKVCKM